jgi:hypothetical protein
VQVPNKIPGGDDQVFTDDDERLLTAMRSFAGVSIAKRKLQNMSAKTSALFDLYYLGGNKLAFSDCFALLMATVMYDTGHARENGGCAAPHS